MPLETKRQRSLASAQHQIFGDVASAMEDTKNVNDAVEGIGIIENQIGCHDRDSHVAAKLATRRTNVGEIRETIDRPSGCPDRTGQ